MEDCGLQQSKFDPCLFVGEKVMWILYVDDLIFCKKKNMTFMISRWNCKSWQLDVDLEQEDDADGFFGATLDHDEGTIFLEIK